MKLKTMVLAVRQAMVYVGDMWKREQWHRNHQPTQGEAP